MFQGSLRLRPTTMCSSRGVAAPLVRLRLVSPATRHHHYHHRRLLATEAAADHDAEKVVGPSSSSSSSSSSSWKTLHLEKRNEVAIVRLDIPDSKVNVLTKALMDDFSSMLNQLEADPSVRAAVLLSSKEGNFVAGADIAMLSACTSAEQLSELSRQGQAIMTRIAQSRIPFVAAIHGHCLGGGLELALACRARVASSSSKTMLGVPEVLLGLLPGAGGTQRLPRLVGYPKALDMILTGRNIKPDRAKKMNLVDVVADPSALEEASLLVARQLAANPKPASPKKRPFLERFLENWELGRQMMFNQARKGVLKQTNGKYPAPLAAIETVEAGLRKGFDAGLKKEAEKFGELGQTTESKSLISIYHAQTALKKNRFGEPKNAYNKVAVIGAGLMGAGIAEVSASNGLTVVLKDQTREALFRGEQRIYQNLSSRVNRKSITPFERDQIMSNVIGVTEDQAFANKHVSNADIVIEAVFEDINVKHRVLQQIESVTSDRCVFASNTSALPISEIAKGSKRPQNVVGMHYFSPVEKMPLLEVITTPQTSNEAAAAAVEVGIRQRKTVIVVKDGPGFYTTRILSPFMVEAAALLQEGVKIKDVDHALKDFGFPVGPITLFDEVGIDVGSHIQPTLARAFGPRMEGANTEMMTEMVEKGMCGRKTQKGFFLYAGKKSKSINPEVEALIAKYHVPPKSAHDEVTIQNRVMLRMVNEAVFCLQDGTLSSTQDGNIGAVFGLGFPPFFGGPFRWIDIVGAAKVADMLHKLRDQLGERFTPAQLLLDFAKSNTKFSSS